MTASEERRRYTARRDTETKWVIVSTEGNEEHDWIDDALTEIHGLPPDRVRLDPYQLLYRPETEIVAIQKALDALALDDEWRSAIDAGLSARKAP